MVVTRGSRHRESKGDIASMKWFVMLRSQDGRFPLPLVDLEDDIVLFDSEAEATAAGNRNPVGEAFGFETYEW